MPSEDELMRQGEAIRKANPERFEQERRLFDAIPKREFRPRDVVTSEKLKPKTQAFIPMNVVVAFCLEAPKRLVVVAVPDYHNMNQVRRVVESEAIAYKANPYGSGGVTFRNGSCIRFVCNEVEQVRGLEISGYSGNPTAEMREALERQCRRRDTAT